MKLRDYPPDAPAQGVRLQRVLASAGVASRRKAEELIRAGRVTVDGETVTELGTRVNADTATIRVDGKVVRSQPFSYLALNKPSGFITTTSDERDRRTVMELVPPVPRLFPVGRLDRDTEGLLLFTNDGDVANRVMHPRFGLVKEYQVLTSAKPSEQVMRNVRSGVEIDGKLVVPDHFWIARENREGVTLSMALHEGMNHVVRRMMEATGIPVERLRRVRIGPLTLSGIPSGTYRQLSPGEVDSLLESLQIPRPRATTHDGPLASPRAGRPRAKSRPRDSSPRRTHGG